MFLKSNEGFVFEKLWNKPCSPQIFFIL